MTVWSRSSKVFQNEDRHTHPTRPISERSQTVPNRPATRIPHFKISPIETVDIRTQLSYSLIRRVRMTGTA